MVYYALINGQEYLVIMKLLSSLILILSMSANAAQHALVIGINKYPFTKQFGDLDAAVNDAQLIAKVVRRQGIILPNHRILLDEKATRANFDRAWEDMLRQAKPEDTLIVTFAGHGSQNQDTPPIDEKDGKDESLLFYDFDGKDGLIIDDQLYSLFEKANKYKIVLLTDACHSSGMVRTARRNIGRKRTGKYNITPSIPVLPSNEADENNQLKHVTHITAVSDDSLVVQETSFDKRHGALSWFFAKALNGEADRNQNRYLEPEELQDFLIEKVSDKMNNQQIPKVKTGDQQVGIKLRSLIVEASDSIINIKIKNTTAPSNLKHIRKVSSSAYDLLFEGINNRIKVFNNTGDEVTSFAAYEHRRWQRVINKHSLLKGLANRFDMQLKPIKIKLKQGDGIHKQGQILNFSIEPGDYQEGLKALTLFNLAGDGSLQFVYPLAEYGDSYRINKFPYNFPPLKVMPPFGGDNLVAILCRQPASQLHQLLKYNSKIPTIEQVMARLKTNTCQIGQYGWFSSY